MVFVTGILMFPFVEEIINQRERQEQQEWVRQQCEWHKLWESKRREERQEHERREGWENKLVEWERRWGEGLLPPQEHRLPDVAKCEIEKQERERRAIWEWKWEQEQQEHGKQDFERGRRWMHCAEPPSKSIFVTMASPITLTRTVLKIERLSSWVPSAANKAKLGRALASAKEVLDDLRGDEIYHAYLREFMARHQAVCAFVIDHSMEITHQDSEQIAELFKELRQLTRKLRNNALNKATRYEKLFDDFLAYREGLSEMLDLASAGQGRLLIDSFTNSLKDVAISARREADFWERQGNKFSDWTNIQETYASASAKMPAFPPDPGEASANDTSNTEIVPPDEPNPNVLVQTTQQVSKSFSQLNTYVVQTQSKFIQKRLVKTSHSLAKGFNKTKAYLDLVKNIAAEEVSKAMVRLVNTVSEVSKVWKKIHFSVKCWSPIWVLLLKPSRTLPSVTVNTQKSSLREGNSSGRYDLAMASIEGACKRLHPFLIDYQAALLSMSNCFSSQVDFWTDAEKRLVHILQESRPIGIGL